MKTAINCDQVFDILTRGPFPSGDATDAPVERHLQYCHECRQLAEALRPAVALFHEAVPSHELDDLPGYHGILHDAWREGPAVAATTLAPQTHRRRSADRWPWLHDFAMSRFAGGLLLGFAAIALVWVLTGPAPDRRPVVEAHANITLPPSLEPDIVLVKLGAVLGNFTMPAACTTAGDPPHGEPAAASRAKPQCCTGCHQATPTTAATRSARRVRPAALGAEATTAVVRTCQICHFAADTGD